MNENREAAFEAAPRIVKPRKRSYTPRPVIAIYQDSMLTEDGQFRTTAELTDALPTMEPTLFAMQGAADFVAQLDNHFYKDYPDSWQWRATSSEREIVRPDGFRTAARVSVVIHYFGWKNGNYHRIVDPISMYGHDLDKLWPEQWPGQTRIVRMLNWAVALRDFCAENDIEVRPTTGGVAAQFLTDPRFYPEARRKVPLATNDNVREHLPGNHYLLAATPGPEHEHTAHYLDQRRAHHYAARTTTFPHADSLYAFGDFVDLATIAFDKPVDGFCGLYCLDLEGPGADPPFSWLRYIDPNRFTDGLDRKFEKLFVYSNELPHLIDSGYTVTGIRAAWGSVRHYDTGLNRYAEWAEGQLDRYNDPRWLKQLLLSTYGTLATRAKQVEAIFRLAKRGEPVRLRTGQYVLDGRYTKAGKKLDPRVANVLHRGMIEAATRSESVGMAQWLDGTGYEVLSIYADAVIVKADDDLPLPPLPEPWGIKTTLNHLQFINQQAFRSGEMTKLPGVSRELVKYRQKSPGVAPRSIKYDALTGEPI